MKPRDFEIAEEPKEGGFKVTKAIEIGPILSELRGVREGIVKALGSTGTGTLHYKETMEQVTKLENLISLMEGEDEK